MGSFFCWRLSELEGRGGLPVDVEIKLREKFNSRLELIGNESGNILFCNKVFFMRRNFQLVYLNNKSSLCVVEVIKIIPIRKLL